MRLASLLTAISATLALVAAPLAAAQSTDAKTQQSKATAPAVKATPKAAAGADKAPKVEGAAAVRTSPADLKKSGSEKSYDGGCGGKMAASDA